MSALALTSQIPMADLGLWAALSDEARRDTQLRLDAMSEIAGAKRAGRGAVQARWASKLELAPKTLKNLWSAYGIAKRAHGLGAWRDLLDTRRFDCPWTQAAGALPAAAKKELRALIRNAPSPKDAHAAFLRRWRAWARGDATQALPGYTECPPDTGQGYPAGFSLRSFQTFAKKEVPDWEKQAVRRGLAGVRANLPQVLTTRIGTWVGAQYQFDDMWHNVQVLFGSGANPIVRVAQLGVVDVHSGCFFDYALKPREVRADGSATDITEAEMRAFTANVLLTSGYDAERGTLIMAENAKATLREDTIQLLHDFTGGKVRVNLAPMQGGRPLVEGWWKGEGGGNPQYKPIIERLHEVLQRTSWQLPGQVGRSVAERPEWLQGMYAEEKALLKAVAEGLRPERAALLRHPFLDYDLHFCPLLREIYALLNGRTEHAMEGWRELGYVERVYRLAAAGEGWFDADELLALPEQQRATLQARVLADARHHTKQRNFSPARVWAQGRGRLRAISEELACLLIARDHVEQDPQRAERLPQGAYFIVQERGVRTAYETRVRTSEGHLRDLAQGEKYQIIPFGTRAFIRDLSGRYLGAAPLAERLHPLDEQALHAAFGHKAERAAAILAPLRADHAPEAARLQANRTHNARVLQGAAITPEEKRQARRRKQRGAAVTAADRAALVARGAAEGAEQNHDKSVVAPNAQAAALSSLA